LCGRFESFKRTGGILERDCLLNGRPLERLKRQRPRELPEAPPWYKLSLLLRVYFVLVDRSRQKCVLDFSVLREEDDHDIMKEESPKNTVKSNSF